MYSNNSKHIRDTVTAGRHNGVIKTFRFRVAVGLDSYAFVSLDIKIVDIKEKYLRFAVSMSSVMAPIILYHSMASAHSRGALFTIRNLGLEVDIKQMNLLAKDQLNPDFIKINPQHCVPTIVDGDFTLWESRAIAVYLIESKAPDSLLYPKDIKHRALVNQRLYFDAGTLYKRIRDICFPIIYLGETTIPDDKRKAMFEAFEWLNGFLNGSDYIAGPTVTVADLFAVSTMLSVVHAGCDIGNFKNIVAWLDRCKTLPGYDENVEGAKMFGQRVKSRLTDKF